MKQAPVSGLNAGRLPRCCDGWVRLWALLTGSGMEKDRLVVVSCVVLLEEKWKCSERSGEWKKKWFVKGKSLCEGILVPTMAVKSKCM